MMYAIGSITSQLSSHLAEQEEIEQHSAPVDAGIMGDRQTGSDYALA